MQATWNWKTRTELDVVNEYNVCAFCHDIWSWMYDILLFFLDDKKGFLEVHDCIQEKDNILY